MLLMAFPSSMVYLYMFRYIYAVTLYSTNVKANILSNLYVPFMVPCDCFLFIKRMRKVVLPTYIHRIVRVGRDLWRLAGPVPPLKQEDPERLARDQVQMAFEYLQRGRLRILSGQPVPVLSHLHFSF